MPEVSKAQALELVRENTQAMEQTRSRLEGLEESTAASIISLRDHFDREFGRVEAQLGSMNAHLDNIARESSIANAHHDTTNTLLKNDLEQRQAERKRALDLEADALDHQRKLETDEIKDTRDEREAVREDKKEVRATVVSAGREAWTIFKQPLAYLVVATVGYLAWAYLGAPPPQQTVPAFPQTQVEADE